MGARILVADDSVTIQKVVELTFSKEDFTLTQARSGADAIRKAKEMRPDLVLLDLVMPDMNGYEVCAAMRAEFALRSTPIILLTGTFESFDPQRGTQVGANDYVTKPFESQVLIGKVKQLLFAKAVDEGAAAAGPKPSGEAVTVKIPPAGPEPFERSVVPTQQAVMAAAPLPRVAPAPVAPPAAVSPPREDLWQLLDTPPQTSSAPSAAAEELAADRSPLGGSEPEATPPAAPEVPSLDLASLDLGLAQLPDSVLETQPSATDTLILPRSLSLDDLLAAGSDVPAAPPTTGAIPEPPMEPQPVFELPAVEAPPLPMVEASTAEPPALSVDDLLGSSLEAEPPAAEPVLELPEIDVAAISEPISVPIEEELLVETPMALEVSEVLPEAEELTVVTEAAAAPVPEPVLAAELVDLLSPAESWEAEPEPSSPPTEVLPQTSAVRAEGFAAVAFESPVVSASIVEEPPAAAPIEATPPDMAAMREAITERVARDLRLELSEKLLDRFEKIVWEVVPDLAEILIAKEIERIRRLAEEEKSS
jgi:CheY-like chemotaxis protein